MFKIALPFFVLMILAIVFAPLAYIWSLNTLFPSLNIEYNITNWLAMLVAHGFFHQTISIKK
jgi:hypothetical protein